MQAGPALGQAINLAEFKRFALQKLPDGLLRDDILSQPDEYSPEEYIADCGVWMRLARLHG